MFDIYTSVTPGAAKLQIYAGTG